MSHAVMYPDDLYSRIAEYARQHGKTPEQALLDFAEAMVTEPPVESQAGTIPDDDPFFQLAGIIQSDDIGWPDRHDEIIAQAVMDDHAKQ